MSRTWGEYLCDDLFDMVNSFHDTADLSKHTFAYTVLYELVYDIRICIKMVMYDIFIEIYNFEISKLIYSL